MSLRRICPINDSEIPAPQRGGVLGYSCHGRSVAGVLGLPGLRTAGLPVDARLGPERGRYLCTSGQESFLGDCVGLF